MSDYYKCHECSIGQCYSESKKTVYPYCQKPSIWIPINKSGKYIDKLIRG